MYCVQITDKERFYTRAKQERALIKVCRIATSVPTLRETSMVLVGAIQFFYTMEFEDSKWGPSRWTFVETNLAGQDRLVLTHSELLQRMEADPEVRVVRVHRAGSLD